jgi:hypothetical protein
MRKAIVVALAATIVVGTSSCASIVSGTKQSVTVTSDPPGAEISIDGKAAGKTPLAVDLRRKEDHVIKGFKEGVGEATVTTTSTSNGWIWGNLLFGGIIGIIIDVSNGAAKRFSPDTYHLQLKR